MTLVAVLCWLAGLQVTGIHDSDQAWAVALARAGEKEVASCFRRLTHG
jgi:hypothetical protein